MVASRRRTESFVDEQSAASRSTGCAWSPPDSRTRSPHFGGGFRSPKRVRTLEERLLSKGQLAQAVSQNEKPYTLREAREHIATLRDEVDKLTQPPSGYGTVLGLNDDDTVDVHAAAADARGGAARTSRLAERGQEVVLNESFNIVMARRPETTGEIATIKEVLEDGRRAMIVGRADEHRVVELGEGVLDGPLRSGDSVLIEPRAGIVLERLPRPDVEELVLEEVPDVSYDDVGGLDDQIEQITDAVELPFVHQALFSEYDLPAPKGILLYGARLRQDTHCESGRQQPAKSRGLRRSRGRSA